LSQRSVMGVRTFAAMQGMVKLDVAAPEHAAVGVTRLLWAGRDQQPSDRVGRGTATGSMAQNSSTVRSRSSNDRYTSVPSESASASSMSTPR